MSKNEQFEALRFLSETHRSLHEKRQKYEWKIIFTTLTFFVASTAAVFSQKVCLPDGAYVSTLIWILFLSFAIVAVCFLYSVHKANARNKFFAEQVEDQVTAIANHKTPAEICFSRDDFRKTYWAFYWQGALILILAIVTATMLTCFQPKILSDINSVDAQTMPNQRPDTDGLHPSASGHR